MVSWYSRAFFSLRDQEKKHWSVGLIKTDNIRWSKILEKDKCSKISPTFFIPFPLEALAELWVQIFVWLTPFLQPLFKLLFPCASAVVTILSSLPGFLSVLFSVSQNQEDYLFYSSIVCSVLELFPPFSHKATPRGIQDLQDRSGTLARRWMDRGTLVALWEKRERYEICQLQEALWGLISALMRRKYMFYTIC